MNEPRIKNPSNPPIEGKANLSSPDPKKSLSRKRIFWALVVIDVLLAIFLVYVILSSFLQ